MRNCSSACSADLSARLARGDGRDSQEAAARFSRAPLLVVRAHWTPTDPAQNVPLPSGDEHRGSGCAPLSQQFVGLGDIGKVEGLPDSDLHLSGYRHVEDATAIRKTAGEFPGGIGEGPTLNGYASTAFTKASSNGALHVTAVPEFGSPPRSRVGRRAWRRSTR